MFERDISQSTGFLSNVLKSGVERYKVETFESVSLPYHDIILKRVVDDLYSISMKTGDSMTSMLEITGLSLNEIMEMRMHEWKTVYNRLRMTKEVINKEMKDTIDKLEKETKK